MRLCPGVDKIDRTVGLDSKHRTVSMIP